jgi:electron-transferring-flavoprotein dehydrogenase
VNTRKYIEELTTRGNPAVGAGFGALHSEAETGDSLERNKKESEIEKETWRKHIEINLGEYAGLLGHACPAGVYEYVPDGDGAHSEEGWAGHKLVINSQVSPSMAKSKLHLLFTLFQNCIHCKLCDVKVPTQDITWTVPEGGGGPKYSEYFSALAHLPLWHQLLTFLAAIT